MNSEIQSFGYETGLRAGNAQREAALAHVERMLASGHLDGEEAGKRANTIANAKTEGEIALAVSDLPKPKPPWGEAWKRFDWDQPKCYVPVLLFTAMLSVAAGAFPFVLASVMGWYHDAPLMNTTGAAGVIIGLIGLIASIAALCVKAD
jgi:Domain of unknown function (DUF1707)